MKTLSFLLFYHVILLTLFSICDIILYVEYRETKGVRHTLSDKHRTLSGKINKKSNRRTIMEERVNEAENSLTGGEEQSFDISSDLIRGHINTIILRSLYDGDKYG